MCWEEGAILNTLREGAWGLIPYEKIIDDI